MREFKNLGLSEDILVVLKQKGFEEPTPIQKQIIPAVLGGNEDIIGQAQTGTGKTAAFGLPILKLLEEKSKHVQAIILTPTRELAIQVAEELNSLKGKKSLYIIPVYGGQSIEMQLKSLRRGVDIVVGTPGRVLDHIKRKTLKLDKISHFILDEADEMLDMGFLDDVVSIMKSAPSEKRTMLFSATMPPEVMRIAKKHMRPYTLFKASEEELTVNLTDQIYFEVYDADKFEALCRIIDIEEDIYGIIFCRTKVDVHKIASHLIQRGYDADALHGDISQSQREKILGRFRKRQINILVATDVAARGIDVQDLTHVINYSLPKDPKSYIHRIGRTGRAGKQGSAITFITPAEYRKLQIIVRETKSTIRKKELPKVKDIIAMKKLRIKAEVEDIILKNLNEEYIKMAKNFLKDNEPDIMLAAFMQYTFEDDLCEKSYTEISDKRVVDDKGKTRLFVTQGKIDGLSSKKLVQFIQNQCNIQSHKIKDVQVLERFSFVTLPFNDAEKLLKLFNKKAKGYGLTIKKAKGKRA